jgi:MYXO-CTERM domain-containing protein
MNAARELNVLVPMGTDHAEKIGISRASARRRLPIPWIVLAPLLVACGGVGDAAPDSEVVGQDRAPLYLGTPGAAADSTASNVVALRIGDGASFLLCSGALVAPNVVLTARHCVAQKLSDTVACDEDGLSMQGPQVGANVPPGTLHVFVGATPNLYGTPAANGRALFAPTGDTLCNSDIAFIVLDRPLTGIAPIPIRLASAARAGEVVHVVGYGTNDQGLPTGVRLRTQPLPVRAVGRGISRNHTPLATHEFELGRSACDGDSGGPAIGEATGAVLGVVSRGASCNDDFGHVFVQPSGFRALLDQAFAYAGAQPIAEPPLASTAGATEPPDLTAGRHGCAAAGAGLPGSPPGAGLVGVLLAFVARRRRRSE